MYRTLEVKIMQKYLFIYDKKTDLEYAYKTDIANDMMDFIEQFSLKYKDNIVESKPIDVVALGVADEPLEEEFERIFIFSDKNVDFENILKELLPIKDKMDIWLYSDVCWEKEDFDNASAFLFNFNKKCPEYETEKYSYYKINCLDCWCRDINDKIYAKPTASIKKYFSNNLVGVSIEESDVHIISDALYEYLIESGINENCFKPVYDKKNQLWAKMLNDRNNLLPSLSLYYEYDDTVRICKSCGRKIISPSYKPKKESYWYEYGDGEGGFGVYPCSERWLIRKDALENMDDVNLTFDYFTDRQLMVISKRLFNLLHEHNPKIIHVSTPIFSEEFSLVENEGELLEV